MVRIGLLHSFIDKNGERRKLTFFEDLLCKFFLGTGAEYFTCIITVNPHNIPMRTIPPISYLKTEHSDVIGLTWSVVVESRVKAKAIVLYIIQSCSVGSSERSDPFKHVQTFLFFGLAEEENEKNHNHYYSFENKLPHST